MNDTHWKAFLILLALTAAATILRGIVAAFWGVIAFFTRGHPVLVWGSVILIVFLIIAIFYLARRKNP